MFSSFTPPPIPPLFQIENEDIAQDKGQGEKNLYESPSSSQLPSSQDFSSSDTIGSTESILADTLSSIRLPKINRDWKKCISDIEKVIDKKPSEQEYNNQASRRRIEQYKDRL